MDVQLVHPPRHAQNVFPINIIYQMANVIHVILKSDVVNVIHHQIYVQNVTQIIIYRMENV